MLTLTPAHAIALTNLDLAFKERATKVNVVHGDLFVTSVNRNGKEIMRRHVKGNVWDIITDDDVTRSHNIDRDVPAHFRDECGEEGM